MVRKVHIYTDEEKEFLKKFVPGHSHREIMDAFEEKFGWPIRVEQVRGVMKRYGLTTGRNGQFVKGQLAHNKGKKMAADVYERCKGTMFKKGHQPANYRPVGSERVNVGGYIEIKVADPNKWRLKHNVVWEKKNGQIPKGHIVMFLDRNPLNTDISNLKLITRSELLVMNRYKIHGDSPEIMEAAVNLAKMMDKINKTVKVKK